MHVKAVMPISAVIRDGAKLFSRNFFNVLSFDFGESEISYFPQLFRTKNSYWAIRRRILLLIPTLAAN